MKQNNNSEYYRQRLEEIRQDNEYYSGLDSMRLCVEAKGDQEIYDNLLMPLFHKKEFQEFTKQAILFYQVANYTLKEKLKIFCKQQLPKLENFLDVLETPPMPNLFPDSHIKELPDIRSVLTAAIDNNSSSILPLIKSLTPEDKKIEPKSKTKSFSFPKLNRYDECKLETYKNMTAMDSNNKPADHFAKYYTDILLPEINNTDEKNLRDCILKLRALIETKKLDKELKKNAIQVYKEITSKHDFSIPPSPQEMKAINLKNKFETQSWERMQHYFRDLKKENKDVLFLQEEIETLLEFPFNSTINAQCKHTLNWFKKYGNPEAKKYAEQLINKPSKIEIEAKKLKAKEAKESEDSEIIANEATLIDEQLIANRKKAKNLVMLNNNELIKKLTSGPDINETIKSYVKLFFYDCCKKGDSYNALFIAEGYELIRWYWSNGYAKNIEALGYPPYGNIHQHLYNTEELDAVLGADNSFNPVTSIPFTDLIKKQSKNFFWFNLMEEEFITKGILEKIYNAAYKDSPINLTNNEIEKLKNAIHFPQCNKIIYDAFLNDRGEAFLQAIIRLNLLNIVFPDFESPENTNLTMEKILEKYKVPHINPQENLIPILNDQNDPRYENARKLMILCITTRSQNDEVRLFAKDNIENYPSLVPEIKAETPPKKQNINVPPTKRRTKKPSHRLSKRERKKLELEDEIKTLKEEMKTRCTNAKEDAADAADGAKESANRAEEAAKKAQAALAITGQAADKALAEFESAKLAQRELEIEYIKNENARLELIEASEIEADKLAAAEIEAETAAAEKEADEILAKEKAAAEIEEKEAAEKKAAETLSHILLNKQAIISEAKEFKIKKKPYKSIQLNRLYQTDLLVYTVSSLKDLDLYAFVGGSTPVHLHRNQTIYGNKTLKCNDWDIRIITESLPNLEELGKRLSKIPRFKDVTVIGNTDHPIIKLQVEGFGLNQEVEIALWQKRSDETHDEAMIRITDQESDSNVSSFCLNVRKDGQLELRGSEENLQSYLDGYINIVDKRNNVFKDDPRRLLRYMMKKELYHLNDHDDLINALFENPPTDFVPESLKIPKKQKQLSTFLEKNLFSQYKSLVDAIELLNKHGMFELFTGISYDSIKDNLSDLKIYDNSKPYTKLLAFYTFLLSHKCAEIAKKEYIPTIEEARKRVEETWPFYKVTKWLFDDKTPGRIKTEDYIYSSKIINQILVKQIRDTSCSTFKMVSSCISSTHYEQREAEAKKLQKQPNQISTLQTQNSFFQPKQNSQVFKGGAILAKSNFQRGYK